MSWRYACLGDFVQPVPTCSGSDRLLNILSAMAHSGSDRLIWVDSQHQPQGCITLNRLLTHLLLANGTLPAVVDVSNPQNRTLAEVEPAMVEPVVSLAADLPLSEGLLPLQTQPQVTYVLVDETAALVGLLDPQKVLQVLATAVFEGRSLLELPDTSESGAASVWREVIVRQQRQMTVLTQQLLAQKGQFELQLRSQQRVIHHLLTHDFPLAAPSDPLPFPETPTSPRSQFQPSPDSGAASPLPLFDALCTLLERLPLPLMLQTNDGLMIVQNAAWRNQIGELLNPDWIHREAALWLEAIDEPTSPSLPGDRDGHSSLVEERCEEGETPNTCVCSCSLKDGQEQTLQLIKIPLGRMLTPSPLQPASPATVPAGVAPAIAHFRLAPLDAPAPQSDPTAAAPITSTSTETPPPEMLWLILAQDITEQQQIARELTAKNADLVQLNRLKDEFLACISHELKTPLTAVLGLSSLLKDQTLGELNPRQVHYAQLIYQSGRHLMSVVNDILDLTRIETGQLALALEPVNLEILCHRAFEQAKQQRFLEEKQEIPQADTCPIAQFSLELEPGLETMVADGLRLRQMLVNLLSNALKFTEAGNQVGLKVNRWGGWIAFTVWDTGIGIPVDKQHLIFQKFQQLENPLTRRFEGTGLGLVLTQRLARLHGGDVTFISREGQGSQFTILLPPEPPEKTHLTRNHETSALDNESFNEYPDGRVPVQSSQGRSPDLRDQNLPTPQQSTPAEQWSAHAMRNRLVLIVESTTQLLDSLSEQLSSLGYRLVIARSGTDALEKARRLQPCVIFLNPLLPTLSGWDVLTLLKSNLETRHIPTIITATQADEEQAYRSQADDFLTVPIQSRNLQLALRNLLVKAQKTEPDSATPTKRLTILRLHPGHQGQDESVISLSDLSYLLHSRHYRLIEADDLQQAELLARIWKPNVTLLDGHTANWQQYLHQFSQHTFLTSLPLVTLDREATEAANQVPGLLVFPYLAKISPEPSPATDLQPSALLQVVQIAAGYAWQPTILILDITTLPLSLKAESQPTVAELGSRPQEAEWLQAMGQYLQTAGFRALMSHAWEETLQQIRSQSVDLLLLGWTDQVLPPFTLYMLSTLQQLEGVPPVLLLDHRSHTQEPGIHAAASPALDAAAPGAALPEMIQALANRTLPGSVSMSELLEQIHQVLQSQPVR